eukprot:CAMPEP_0175444682 /NCGR_PEP_ID=MMETSP0095-20121207/59345_1 /TAXON_ID=311494 /ORGANISM="Alexandrium monilatum, Strain CCMP3105" /LENGTH=33 /DNA_ID= /DNA_START= /DNA_END= /DNA_ORIENTATION=
MQRAKAAGPLGKEGGDGAEVRWRDVPNMLHAKG